MPLPVAPQIPTGARMQTGGYPGVGGGGVGRYAAPDSQMIPGPPTSEEDRAQRTGAWDDFMRQLSEPGMNQVLFQMGTEMMQDRAPGQSNLDAFSRALRGGVGSYTGLLQQEAASRAQDRAEGRAERGVVVQEKQAETARRTQRDTARHQTAQDTIASAEAETARMRADAAIKQAEALSRYYDALAQTAGATGNSKATAEALKQSLEGYKARLASIDKSLELAEGEERTNLLRAKSALINNFISEVQRATAVFTGGNPVYAGPVPKTRAQAEFLIKGDPRYEMDPAWRATADATMASPEFQAKYPEEELVPPPAEGAAAPAASAASSTTTPAAETPPAEPQAPYSASGFAPTSVFSGYDVVKQWQAKRIANPIIEALAAGKQPSAHVIESVRQYMETAGLTPEYFPEEVRPFLVKEK